MLIVESVVLPCFLFLLEVEGELVHDVESHYFEIVLVTLQDRLSLLGLREVHSFYL